MNLLEIVSTVSAAAHLEKVERAANNQPHAGCGCDDPLCHWQLPTTVLAFRGGEHVVTMWLTDHHLKYPVDIASRLYSADAVAVGIDGVSRLTGQSVVVVDAVNRAGDEMWRVEPYRVFARKLIWEPAEVPDRHPLLEEWNDGYLKSVMNKKPITPPPFMNDITPGMTHEQRQTIMDIGITRQITKHADSAWCNIAAVTLASSPGTARERILHQATDPRIWM